MTPGEIAKALRGLMVFCDSRGKAEAVIADAADALEQLSAPVLPEEVAHAVERLGNFHSFVTYDEQRDYARLLQRLAGELAEAVAWQAAKREWIDVAERTMKGLLEKLAARDAELAMAKPLLDAAVEEHAYWRKLDNVGDLMVVDDWTFAKNALRDAARSYALAKLDAKEG